MTTQDRLATHGLSLHPSPNGDQHEVRDSRGEVVRQFTWRHYIGLWLDGVEWGSKTTLRDCQDIVAECETVHSAITALFKRGKS